MSVPDPHTFGPEGPAAPERARRVVVLIADLMFVSKVREALKGTGLEPVTVSSREALGDALAGPAALLIADLGETKTAPIDAIRMAKERGIAVLAYGSHVDAEALAAGRRAGADTVVPRSVFAASLAPLIQELVGAGDAD